MGGRNQGIILDKQPNRILSMADFALSCNHTHFTTREVPAVALGILERRLSVQEMFQIQMA